MVELTVIIGIGVEEMSVEKSVLIRPASPHLPEFIAERILDKLV